MFFLSKESSSWVLELSYKPWIFFYIITSNLLPYCYKQCFLIHVCLIYQKICLYLVLWNRYNTMMKINLVIKAFLIFSFFSFKLNHNWVGWLDFCVICNGRWVVGGVLMPDRRWQSCWKRLNTRSFRGFIYNNKSNSEI